MAEAATPALPLELIELIISHSLPPLAFATFPARYDLLFTFSTVSKSWHEIAIRALYKELWIADDVAEQLLWERVGARGEGGTKRVKRLWCGRVPTDADNEVYSSHFVDRALSYSPNVKRVQLVALGLTSLDFAAFDHIEELDITCTELYGTAPLHERPRPPKPLPALTRLRLDNPYLDGGTFGPWSHLFNRKTLPNLRHLSLSVGSWHQDINTDEQALYDALEELGPGLESLVYICYRQESVEGNISRILPSLTSLRRLHLRGLDPELWDDDFHRTLPPSLEHLSFSLQPYESERTLSIKGLTACLLDKGAHLPRLHTLSLCCPSSYAREHSTSVLEPLRLAMERRGGSLVFYDFDNSAEETAIWDSFPY